MASRPQIKFRFLKLASGAHPASLPQDTTQTRHLGPTKPCRPCYVLRTHQAHSQSLKIHLALLPCYRNCCLTCTTNSLLTCSGASSGSLRCFSMSVPGSVSVVPLQITGLAWNHSFVSTCLPPGWTCPVWNHGIYCLFSPPTHVGNILHKCFLNKFTLGCVSAERQ